MVAKRVRFVDDAGAVRRGRLVDDHIHFGNEQYPFDDADILPPVEPTNIIGVGKTYESLLEDLGHEIPEQPTLFLMTPKTLVGHGETVQLPATDEEIVFEGEIGVVIDDECRNVSKADAGKYIRGYTCVNDITNFDRVDQGLVRAKAFDYAAPIGPAVAPPEVVPDDATLELRVNGERKQRTSMADLIFSIEELIADISSFMTLEPGDVISSGTPAGVGPLTDGDTVEVEVEGVGTLAHGVKR